MSALDDIRDSLKTALESVSGLHAYARVPGQINTTFEGGATYTLPVQVLVQLGEWDAAQEQLDEFVAHDGTATDAINEATVEARVTRMESYGLTPYAGVDYLGALLIVEVLV